MTIKIFHESLDSARVTSQDPARHPNLAQAQTEVLISLLLGRTVSVSGAYAFDSRSFLELAEVVLDSRAALLAECPTGSPGHRRLSAAVPFQLNWYPATTAVTNLRTACAEQLDRTGFVLSNWREINDDDTARGALAEALRADLKAPSGLDHDLLERFETLRRVLDYADSGERCKRAGGPALSLSNYLRYFAGLDQHGIERLAERAGCPVLLAVDLREEIRGRSGVLDSRSWAHDVIIRAARYRDPQLPLLVRELVDTCYNAVIADSCGAAAVYLSSVPRVDGRAELKHVNAMAKCLIEQCREKLPGAAAEPKPAPITGLLAPAEVVEQVAPTPLRLLFDAHWRLVADDETHRLWSDSCADLEDQLAPHAGGNTALAEVWASHLDLLRTSIPGLLVDGTTMAIGAAHRAGCYAQTHQLGRPEADQLAAAHSVGEYLDELSLIRQ